MRPAISGSSLATRHAMPLMIAAFCLLWSSAFAVAKLALADCPPLLLLTARFLLAGGLMLTVAAADGAPWRLSRRDILVLAVLGVANNALYLGLNYIGMRSISAGLPPGARPGTHGRVVYERVAWSDLIGVIPVALGIYLVTRTGEATARAREAGAGFAARAGHRQEDVMRSSKASQSRLNTIDANQPVAIAIIAVARP